MMREAAVGDFLSPASFWKPDYLTVSAWLEHAPFAFWLVDACRPKMFVELGTHAGFSYLSFCQAVARLEIPSRGFAIDHWKGDEQSSFYGEEVFEELVAYHDPHYASFSRLVRSTFDDAVAHFEDDSIDLLHIDGLHTYEAALHDFETWRPKLSSRAVVLLHDTNVREQDFGVHKLWAELRAEHPSFEFVHGHGLGVLGVGPELPAALGALVDREHDESALAGIRAAYAHLGDAVKMRFEAGEIRSAFNAEISGLHERLTEALTAHETDVTTLQRALEERDIELASVRADDAALLARAAELEHTANVLLTSNSWRVTAPLRALGHWARMWSRESSAPRDAESLQWRGAASRFRHPRVVALGKRVLPRPVRQLIKRRFPEAVEALMHPPSVGLQSVRTKTTLFVSGAPEVAKRYRCDHQAEQLELLGATVDVATHGELDLAVVAGDYRLFVLHRVAWGRDVEIFLERVRALGGVAVFDTDDLVFDTDVMPDVAALQDMPPEEVQLYADGLHRYRRTMRECDAVTVSTESLAELAKALHDRVLVTPNVASVAMIESATSVGREVRSGDNPESGTVTIGYLSGTNTHRTDFLEAAEGLLAVIENRPNVRLLVVGPLPLDSRFDRFGARIEQLPLQPWSLLSTLQSRVDINLAPLESRNTYTESKSCVKWIEAGLVGVPTIASPRADFTRVIVDGENGVLADDPTAWQTALRTLVDDPKLRREIGERARSEILHAHTSRTCAFDYREALRELLGEKDDRKLAINWVLEAPIAANSGGYRNIFRIAEKLGAKGHVQHLCINPVAHLAGMSDEQIRTFVDETFGIPENADVVSGHSPLPPADVSIATFWSTAPIVAKHNESLFKAYFIQDFEPEFYDQSDPRYEEAARTYELPLRHICLGTHLGNRLAEHAGILPEVVDFALDPEFRLTRPPESRGEPVRVLFFARPSLRRRGYELGLEALSQVKEAHPEVDIAFFGSSSEELGSVPIEFRNLGVLDATGVADAMNSSHILVCFSLTNISNVPFEGMACGCAVVDLDLPNVSTMVEAGRNCLLAAPEPAALANAVVSLIEDREFRERLARVGAAEAVERTWTRTARMFEDSLIRTCFARLPTPAVPPQPAEMELAR